MHSETHDLEQNENTKIGETWISTKGHSSTLMCYVKFATWFMNLFEISNGMAGRLKHKKISAVDEA